MITSNGLLQLGFTREEFSLQDNSDGKGVFIAQWNSESPQPTVQEIETAHGLWETEQANAVAQKAADKQSAHDKLSALGLSDAEIIALTGGA